MNRQKDHLTNEESPKEHQKKRKTASIQRAGENPPTLKMTASETLGKINA